MIVKENHSSDANRFTWYVSLYLYQSSDNDVCFTDESYQPFFEKTEKLIKKTKHHVF